LKNLIVITGPTAIGKTSLAIALAQHYGCDIISADSRQFFQEMTIGTAVPSIQELASAKHHFIQQLSIHQNYTVGDFEKQAISTLNQIYETSDFAILVGGSGLYINAITDGLDTFPEINPEIRIKIQKNYDQIGISYLQEEFKKLDPIYYTQILKSNPQTLQNPQRLMRFIEVSQGTQNPYSTFLNQKSTSRNFNTILIGLDANRETIYSRINERVDLMVLNGLLDEVQKLHPNKNLNALQTVGYKELFDYFEGKSTLENAIQNIKQNTRRFAKRQLTWFKRNQNTQWFDFETPIQKIIEFIETKIMNI
jgi:tRNA dimethylallyltransferase